MSLQLLGTIASSISLLHVIPQTLKTVRTKDVSSYSKPSVLLGIASTMVWMYMYYKQKLHIPIAVSIIYVLIDLYVISLIVKAEQDGSDGQ